MSVDVDTRILQSIHALLRQQSDLQERLTRAPRVIKAAENNQAACEQKLQTVRDEIRQTRKKADDKQLQLAEREDHIEKLRNQRNSCDSNREYKVFTEQILADEQANGVLQDEILELLEKVDSLESDATRLENDLERLTEESSRTRERVQQELETAKQDLEVVQRDLTERESQLPPDVRAEYRRLVAALGEGALSCVEDNSCGHCYQVVSAQSLSQLKMSRATYCSNCGSLMYLPQSANTPEAAR